MSADRDVFKEAAERVEELLERFGALPAATGARADAQELVQTVSGMYGHGLGRLLERLSATLGADAQRVLEDCCNDTLVAALLVTHGLHPVSLTERVHRAVDSVRPYLRSHKGDVEVIGITEDVVELRLQGSCDGCSASHATLKLAIERAIFAAAPEVLEVRAAQPTAPEHAPPETGMLPVVL